MLLNPIQSQVFTSLDAWQPLDCAALLPVLLNGPKWTPELSLQVLVHPPTTVSLNSKYLVDPWRVALLGSPRLCTDSIVLNCHLDVNIFILL